ncbi:MAG: two-component system, OmpR family, alkaline phosphatase synthesis response regulator PhoP [Gaiellaceae bacterium]|jgi:DNA-binding response OmpR family regulator|nr:two-component system, OmpR family, alkaline phosphatase synthesis response regulator PhoP [Gaiellaceae bacterium]
MTRILVVDDEPTILDSVGYALQREGFEVSSARDGTEGLRLAREENPDVIVLDVMLPGLSGREVCRQLRSESDVPILMLSARGGEVDRVLGLELGADDYVTKPFSLAELVSRIRALLRRRELDRTHRDALRIGDLELDLAAHDARIDGIRVHLTPSEFRLVALLATAPGRAFSRAELVRHLWETEYTGGERAVDAHVVNLRRKLERDPAEPRRLVTVRGIGYALATE